MKEPIREAQPGQQSDSSAVLCAPSSSPEHCMAEWKPWEQRNTCLKCAHPLADNELVKDGFKVNTTAAWAKGNLKILADMAEDNRLPQWFIAEVNRIKEGIRLMGA